MTDGSAQDLRCLLIGMRGGGGEEIFLRDLVAHPPRGIDYTVVHDQHASVSGARCRRLTEIAFNRLVQPFLWPLPGLRAYEVDDRFDLVHVHVYLSHLRVRPKVPVVMSVSNSYYHYIRDYLEWDPAAVDALYARARRVLPKLRITNEFVSSKGLAGISVLSKFARTALTSRGVPAELVSVIPPGFATPPERTPTPSDSFSFLFAGRQPRRKGADLVIEAIRRLRRGGLDVRAVLAGDESFLELRGEAGFEVHGPVSRQFLTEKLYPAADAFAMPSRAEGYGFTLVEAMSHGLPVISSTYGSIPEVVEHEVSGLLTPVGDADALVEAMSTLATDRPAARAMGAAGRSRFEVEFTRERFLDRTRAWYDRARAQA
jgi:glycosyltransferase involved in cell wall biosynthesis